LLPEGKRKKAPLKTLGESKERKKNTTSSPPRGWSDERKKKKGGKKLRFPRGEKKDKKPVPSFSSSLSRSILLGSRKRLEGKKKGKKKIS